MSSVLGGENVEIFGQCFKTEKEKREDAEENPKEYEKTKRDRTFQEAWKEGRPWLMHKNGLLFCSFCVDYGGVGDFVAGCDQVKMDSITKHSQSKSHIKCEATAVLALESSSAPGIVRSLYHETNKKLTILFWNIHALVKNNRPLRDYLWLNNLHAGLLNLHLGY